MPAGQASGEGGGGPFPVKSEIAPQDAGKASKPPPSTGPPLAVPLWVFPPRRELSFPAALSSCGQWRSERRTGPRFAPSGGPSVLPARGPITAPVVPPRIVPSHVPVVPARCRRPAIRRSPSRARCCVRRCQDQPLRPVFIRAGRPLSGAGSSRNRHSRRAARLFRHFESRSGRNPAC